MPEVSHTTRISRDRGCLTPVLSSREGKKGPSCTLGHGVLGTNLGTGGGGRPVRAAPGGSPREPAAGEHAQLLQRWGGERRTADEMAGTRSQSQRLDLPQGRKDKAWRWASSAEERCVAGAGAAGRAGTQVGLGDSAAPEKVLVGTRRRQRDGEGARCGVC